MQEGRSAIKQECRRAEEQELRSAGGQKQGGREVAGVKECRRAEGQECIRA